MYKREYLTEKDYAEQVQYDNPLSYPQIVFRESSPVDEFYTETCQAPDDAMPSVSHVDPILVLFNQERLQSLGEMGIKAFLDSLQQSESSVAELRKKCSDKDLCEMIKSRYLQTPSEVTAWCRYIDSNVEAFNYEMQQLAESQKQTTATNVSVEPQNAEP